MHFMHSRVLCSFTTLLGKRNPRKIRPRVERTQALMQIHAWHRERKRRIKIDECTCHVQSIGYDIRRATRILHNSRIYEFPSSWISFLLQRHSYLKVQNSNQPPFRSDDSDQAVLQAAATSSALRYRSIGRVRAALHPELSRLAADNFNQTDGSRIPSIGSPLAANFQRFWKSHERIPDTPDMIKHKLD